MAKAKKFYWIKLQKDFFKRHDIKVIEAMPNGKDYILFYLKLLVESVSHNGNLRFSDTIPYNAEMLSAVTNTNIDIVRSATKIFTELNLMDMLDDQTIYMTELNKMVGSETEWAAKKRLQRTRDQPLLEDNSGTGLGQKRTMSDKSKELRVKSKELRVKSKDNKESIEKTDDKSSCPYSDIQNLYSSICKSFPKLTKLSDARKKAIKARLNSGYTVDDFKKLFEMSEGSTFLKGKNKRNWRATFDWLIKDANMAKVLDGNYIDKNPQREEQSTTYNIEEYENNPVFGSFER